MSLEQDLAQFRAKLDLAIDNSMKYLVSTAASEKIAEAVESEVYAKYTPTMYERRKEEGGLSDRSGGNFETQYDSAKKTLTIWNANRDDETGRLVAPVVESGKGYQYKSIAPRPFHKIAEQRMITDGTFEQTLAQGLREQGFTVKTV